MGITGDGIQLRDNSTEHIRYSGNVVGVTGYTAVGGFKVFVWNQTRLRMCDGYGMSQGLYKKLDSDDVKYVFIKDADSMVELESVKDGEFLEPWDDRFNKPRTEGQFVVRPSA